MRILLYSGKGGVGKTSLAAATGIRLAQMGRRTLIMSVDPAHSLADSFDLRSQLFPAETADPLEIAPQLFLQEVNINREMKRYWADITGYLTSILRTSGLEGVEAEEMAIFPGMEELSAMLYVNKYRRDGQFDVVVLDCAPTAESLRFVSLPTTLGWYMKHIFGFERNLLKAVRPLAKRIGPVELPPDRYFQNLQDLFEKLSGVDTALGDTNVTSVRLVTNPEKMVLRETERAFVYFSLHGLTVDHIIVNRVLPKEVSDEFFRAVREEQEDMIQEIERYFTPVPIRQVPLFPHEVLGFDRLSALSARLFAEGDDPAAVTRTTRPFTFSHEGDHHEISIEFPFAEKGEIGLFKKADELIVEVGTVRRQIGLPTTMANLKPVKAHLDGRILKVEMREGV